MLLMLANNDANAGKQCCKCWQTMMLMMANNVFNASKQSCYGFK